MALSSPTRVGRRKRVRSRRLTLRIVLVVGVVLIACATWVGVRAIMAKGELEAAVPLATAVQQRIIDGQSAEAQTASDQLSAHALAAAGLTSDPVWRAFEFIPLLGPNLTVSRELAGVVAEISENAIAPLAALAQGFGVESLTPVDGAIDVQPLVDAQPTLSEVGVSLDRANARMAALDTSTVLGEVRDATERLDGALLGATQSVDSIDRAARLLPAMLGVEEPRKYLLYFQNNAEVRATGGLPGALALIETGGGSFQLTRQVEGSSFPKYPAPVLDLPIETRGLFSDLVSTYMIDTNLTPHFPTTGALVREMWDRRFNESLDGVISIDPVALSYLLKATGPLTLASGDKLTSENAVQLLLVDVYERYTDTAVQDAFFADAAAAVFDALANGAANPRTLLAALARSGEERRILLWSAHEEDQAVLAGTTLTGELPVSDTEAERFGIYLNDVTMSKMDVYLDVEVGVGEVTCRDDGRPYYAVDVTMRNTVPLDAADDLPPYVTGDGSAGTQPGDILTSVLVYAPQSAQNLGVSQDGVAVAHHPAIHLEHPVSQLRVYLTPGQVVTTRFHWLGASGAHGQLTAVTTPSIYKHDTQQVAVSCELP